MKIISLAEAAEQALSHDPDINKRVLLQRGDVPRLTNFSRARLKPGQRTTAHSHADMSEVFFVESGEGLMLVDGREVGIASGVCVAVAPCETHEIVNTGEADLVLLYFGVEV